MRQLSKLLAEEHVVQPVIEPVKLADSTLSITLRHCEQNKCVSWVVVNPRLLDFKGKSDKAQFDWGLALFGKVRDRKFTRPLLLVDDSLTPPVIKAFAKQFAGQEVGLVAVPSALDIEEVLVLLKGVSVSRIFFKGPSPASSTLRIAGKERCVLVEDRFPYQSRNADYSGRHFFTDSHLTYAGAGWGGFSDYTVLPPAPSDGGGPPGAVAIHMCYVPLQKATKELWVEHFISDRTDQAEKDTDGKFLEALKKFSRAVKRGDSDFGLTEAAKEYLRRHSDQDPPDLGTNKQLEVLHHLELVSGVLSRRF